MFRSFAAHHPDSPRADTALVRAAQVALSRMEGPSRAVECYRTLLAEHPNSQWRTLAQEKLMEVRADAPADGPDHSSAQGVPTNTAV